MLSAKEIQILNEAIDALFSCGVDDKDKQKEIIRNFEKKLHHDIKNPGGLLTFLLEYRGCYIDRVMESFGDLPL